MMEMATARTALRKTAKNRTDCREGQRRDQTRPDSGRPAKDGECPEDEQRQPEQQGKTLGEQADIVMGAEELSRELQERDAGHHQDAQEQPRPGVGDGRSRVHDAKGTLNGYALPWPMERRSLSRRSTGRSLRRP
jgi:hypothetical protein